MTKQVNATRGIEILFVFIFQATLTDVKMLSVQKLILQHHFLDMVYLLYQDAKRFYFRAFATQCSLDTKNSYGVGILPSIHHFVAETEDLHFEMRHFNIMTVVKVKQRVGESN
jgi:hypothetical protein